MAPDRNQIHIRSGPGPFYLWDTAFKDSKCQKRAFYVEEALTGAVNINEKMT
jgi:hypothetical protein